MFIKRSESGQIEQVSREATEECREFVPPCSPELQAFVAEGEDHDNQALTQSDLAFVRVLEDVINVLMDKGVISFTDLPEPAQQKLLDRQSLRKRINSVGLMPDSEDDTI
ncbi:tryptophan synthase subunit beta like protein [Billgrantia kenyensis]|uniref:Tryptophan synthase subunit beta like protein n=1 Tax=Billgrantia kenyensis TaxID=321266 RepID=A0A7V9W0R1_9GAMM|nr:tryptophan synthase subunit beta like protein [Halomonas kenyensis]MBA2778938.1 tryptophan synthase subunit beta like protein [Halomonas kenyensis]MCG6662865.1 tryptophan synthase subunit beta like protein [Halomonas kenyensis]